MNDFCSNIVKNLKIPEYENLNLNIENIKDQLFRAILKYKKTPTYHCNKKNVEYSFHKVNNEKNKFLINLRFFLKKLGG